MTNVKNIKADCEALLEKIKDLECSVGAESNDKLMNVLNCLYGMIWCEAVYDPDNEHTQKFAKKLLPFIQEANGVLKFKK
jgi:hypothetical protein